MRNYSAAFQAHLDSGTTTLCFCWKVTRADGVVMGFTDHDENLTVLGVEYEASTGFSATQIEANLDLAVDNLEVDGALQSEGISEEDLALGLYDGAEVLVYWVNWRDPTVWALMSRSTIGEVTRNGIAFVAELRSLAQQLQQRVGRQFQRYCDAILGEPRCGVDLSLPAFRGEGEVADVTGRIIRATGIDSFTTDWFTNGLISFGGEEFRVKRHLNVGGVVTLELWEIMVAPPADGTELVVTAGCNKSIGQCRTRFSNHLNFQGFNLMPGTDALTDYPTVGDSSQDGLSLFR